MKNTKKVFNHFADWELTELSDYLTEMSEDGWQLEKSGLFKLIFKKDDSVRYIYRVDFCDSPKKRYYETFEEQGWESVCTIGRITDQRCFRKVYDSSLPESEYEIYTDSESKKAMYKKAAHTSGCLAIMWTCIFASLVMQNFNAGFHTSAWALAAAYAILAFIFWLVPIQFLRKAKNGEKKLRMNGKVTLVLSLISLIPLLFNVFLVFRGNYIDGHTHMLETNMTWGATMPAEDSPLGNLEMNWEEAVGQDIEKPMHELDFTIEEEADYHLNLRFTQTDGKIAVEIVNSDGDEFYSQKPAKECDIEKQILHLLPGDYTANVFVSPDSENADFSISVDKIW